MITLCYMILNMEKEKNNNNNYIYRQITVDGSIATYFRKVIEVININNKILSL